MTTNDKNVPKSPSEYLCEKCNYKTQHKRDYDKHLLTAKHKNLTNSGEKDTEKLICSGCGKKYTSRAGLWSHSKKCSKILDELVTMEKANVKKAFNVETNAGIIMEIIKENQEFKNLLVEQNKQVMELQKENKDMINKMVEITQNQLSLPSTINNNTNNTNTINNNQKFNLNFFLNETCKDAMSIQEFLENIRITFEDLLLIGDAGFVTGVSDILIKQLRDMEVNKRPIHCTDSKRETIYLKEDTSWNKDDKEKTKLKEIIEKLEYKNVVALRDWCNENPDAKVNNTPNNLLKDKIYYQTLQGDERTRDKIIKNISKEVVVDKEN
jgi:hypothetical protein